MKRVWLLSALEKSLRSYVPKSKLRRGLAMGLTCGSVGLVIGVFADVGTGAQTAIALAALWQGEDRLAVGHHLCRVTQDTGRPARALNCCGLGQASCLRSRCRTAAEYSNSADPG